jgi:flagellar hook protein FlgE
MFTAFSTALSALNANETAIDVVGNNLANLNSTGYKASAVNFRDLVTQSVGAGLGETQVGFGTATPYTQRQFTQGAVQATGGILDSAIQGDGFFITTNSQGAQLFTRAGNFQTNTAGYLMTASGEYVQGWAEDAGGNVNTNTPLGNIVVPIGDLKAPIPTTTCSLDANLSAAAVTGDTFSQPIDVYDSLGTKHQLTLTFTKTSTPNEWNYNVTIPGADVGQAGPQTIVPDTPVDFDPTTGRLVAGTTPSVPITVTGLADLAQDLNITWNLYNATGAPRLSQYDAISAPTANAQNGAPAASLTKVGIADGGQILASYSNGTQRVVGQLALASIRNPQSLIASGNNNFQSSAATALPAIGLPNTGGRGTVVGAALEASTVSIAKEFTNLIVFQRAYEVNSKVVTTVDEISQATVNLKR